MSQDDHGEVSLDSDEIDSDSVLEEDDLSDDLAIAEQPQSKPEIKQRALKRKIDITNPEKEESKNGAEENGTSSKKIVLNRSTSVSVTAASTPDEQKTEEESAKPVPTSKGEKVKITANLDPDNKLETNAKKSPVAMTDAEKREARKIRFGPSASDNSKTTSIMTDVPNDLEKLKKRAERFGQSVSKLMTDIEKKEKLEKRKAKFATVK